VIGGLDWLEGSALWLDVLILYSIFSSLHSEHRLRYESPCGRSEAMPNRPHGGSVLIYRLSNGDGRRRSRRKLRQGLSTVVKFVEMQGMEVKGVKIAARKSSAEQQKNSSGPSAFVRVEDTARAIAKKETRTKTGRFTDPAGHHQPPRSHVDYRAPAVIVQQMFLQASRPKKHS
jgi:hypothetical protein